MAIAGITAGDVVYSGFVGGKLRDSGGQVFNVKAFGALGDGVTDDRDAIQAAIDEAKPLHGRVYIPNGTYVFNTPLDIDSATSLTLEGEAGISWAFNPSDSTIGRVGARLLYKGTGIEAAISALGTLGVTFRNLGIHYDDVAFIGDLVDMGPSGVSQSASGFNLFDNCYLSGWNDSIISAKSLVSLEFANGCNFRTTVLARADVAVRGVESAGQASNSNVWTQCLINGPFTTAMFKNPGIGWSFYGCTFEFLTTPTCITVVDYFPAEGSVIAFRDCSFWDATSGVPKAIHQPAGSFWTLLIDGCYFDAFPSVVAITLEGTGSVTIDHNTFARILQASDVLIDLGESATAKKNFASVKGNTWFGEGLAAISNISGHENVDISGNDVRGGVREIATLNGQERLGYKPGGASRFPTIAAHSGQSLAGVSIVGSDAGGFIVITTGASPTIAGDLADIAFALPYIPFGLDGQINAADRLPCIQLTPMHYPGSDVSDAVAAGAYYAVDAGTQTGFRLGTMNVVAAGKIIVYAYRVIQI